ncbi:hypothetical protein GQ54DRAFT_14844 [Martensiomyces pterosporus]|nr:hypothetical protein GQ54DRAFT_14844 [Martensiomyces pterosporus]
MRRSDNAADEANESSTPQRLLFDPLTGTHRPIESPRSARQSRGASHRKSPTPAKKEANAEDARRTPQPKRTASTPRAEARSLSDALDDGGRKKGGSRKKNHRQASERTPVVPKILLVRPERAVEKDPGGRAPGSTVQLLSRQQPPGASPSPSPSPVASPQVLKTQHADRSAPSRAAALPADLHSGRDLSGARQGAERAVPTGRLRLMSPSGKLDVLAARRSLGTLQHRLCVSALGRAGVGKSLLMSRLAHKYSSEHIFKSASPEATSGGCETLGIDFCVTGSRILLLDTPPVFSLQAAERWMKRGESGMSRHAASRLRDLQLVSLLMQISDILLVVVNVNGDAAALAEKKKEKVGLAELGVLDKGIAGLLAMAGALAPAIPGLAAPFQPPKPAAPGHTQDPVDRRGCRLHIVVNERHSLQGSGAPGLFDAKGIAAAYEEASGIAVAGVSFVASNDRHSAKETPKLSVDSIVGRWASSAPHYLPMYPPLTATGGGKEAVKSLLSWDLLDSLRRERLACIHDGAHHTHAWSFEESMENLRARVLSRYISSAGCWKEDGQEQGAWMARCVRAWESIRRSDQLQDMAATRGADLDPGPRTTPTTASVADKSRRRGGGGGGARRRNVAAR